MQDELRDDDLLEYFRAKYEVAAYKVDLYHLFIEQGLQLLRDGGLFSMITPSNFLTNNHLAELRRTILDDSRIRNIMLVDGGVFDGISVDNAIFLLEGGKRTDQQFDIVHAVPNAGALKISEARPADPGRIRTDKHLLLTGGGTEAVSDLHERLRKACWSLGEVAHVNFGKQLRNRKKFEEDVIQIESVEACPESHRPCYTGSNVTRWRVTWDGLACLDDEVAKRGGTWNPDRQNAVNKLLTRQVGRYPEFGIDEAGYQCLNTIFMVKVDRDDVSPYYLLGVLNSMLLRALWLDRYYDQRRTFPKIKGTYLKKLPVLPRQLDPEHQEEIAHVAEHLVRLRGRMEEARTPDQRSSVQRQMATAEGKLERAVASAFRLTGVETAAVGEFVEGVE